MTTGLIIGATGGIGEACIAPLHPSVSQLILSSRNEVRLAAIARRAGADTEWVPADLADANGRRAILDAVRAAGSPLRWVVIASGAPLRGELTELDEASITSTIQSNLTGPALLLRALAGTEWTPRAGVVVIGSISATRAIAKRSVYAASKAGLERLALSLAAEWAPRGIRVNVIAPGVIDTPFLGSDHNQLNEWTSAHVPAGRLGRSEEVAEVVRYVLLDAPDYLLGTRIAVDGGTEAIA